MHSSAVVVCGSGPKDLPTSHRSEQEEHFSDSGESGCLLLDVFMIR